MPAITWIDGQRSLEHVLRLLELACTQQSLAFML